MSQFLGLAFFSSLLMVALCHAQESGPHALTFGDPRAPSVLIEYSSPTCRICSFFIKDIYPSLNKDYLKSGKIQLKVITLPYNQVDLGVSLLIHGCPDPNRLYLYLLENQEAWLHHKNPVLAARKLTQQLFGLSNRQAGALLKNERLLNALVAQRVECDKDKACKVKGLPTFKIGKLTIDGLFPWKKFKHLLEKGISQSLNPSGSALPSEQGELHG